MKTRTGHLYQKRPGGNWILRTVVDGTVFVKSTGTPNRREAERKRSELMRPYVLGNEIDVLKSVSARLSDAESEFAAVEAELKPPPKVARVWDLFLTSPNRKDSGPATLRKYESEWDRFAAWLVTKHPETEHLHQVTSAMAADYARDMTAAKFSASTFNQHRNLLRMVWRVLDEECRLTANPWDKIAPKSLNALVNRKRALTPAQYESLLNAAESTPDLRDLFVLLAWTGLRLADAVLMKWGSVDFARRVISLAPIKTARRQGKVVHIPIFPAALEVLNRRQAGKPVNPAGRVFPDPASLYERDTAALSKRITKAFNRAGIETTEERADRGQAAVVYGAHSLRHFFVSAATAAGMPAAMIKSITGHATDAMLEHYQHLGADLAADMALRIGTNTVVATKPQKALPAPPGSEITAAPDIRAEIRDLAEAMTARNWRTKRDDIVAVVGGTGVASTSLRQAKPRSRTGARR